MDMEDTPQVAKARQQIKDKKQMTDKKDGAAALKKDPAMEAYSAWMTAMARGGVAIVESKQAPQSPAYRRTDVLDGPSPVISEGGWESEDGGSSEKRERDERNDEAYKKWKKSSKKAEKPAPKPKCTKEEVEEPIEEISKEKAGRYIRAAHDDDASSHFHQGVRAGAGESNPTKTNKFFDTKEKRGIGIRTAVRKLTGNDIKVPATEEVEFSPEEIARIEQIAETPVTRKKGPVGAAPKGTLAHPDTKKHMKELRKKYPPSYSGPIRPFKPEVKEDVAEPIEELTKTLLKRYVKKAAAWKPTRSAKSKAKAPKRDKGVNQALNKLTHSTYGLDSHMSKRGWLAKRTRERNERKKPEYWDRMNYEPGRSRNPTTGWE